MVGFVKNKIKYKLKWIRTNARIWHCEKKLACLLFDYGIVNTMEDDCEQVPSFALSFYSWQHRQRDDGRARLTTAVGRRQVEHEAVLIFYTFLFI